MGIIIGIIAIPLALLIVYAVVDRASKSATQSTKSNSKTRHGSANSEEDVSAHSPSQQQLQDDESLEGLKTVLMTLFTTLSTSIDDLEIDSGYYSDKLASQRSSIKESMTLGDLKSLGEELLKHVETMSSSNMHYRSRLSAANDLLKHQQDELIGLQIELGTDFLTGTNNRAALEEHLKVMMNISRRYGNVYSLMVLDIDFFKRVNDTFGHMAGDAVLRDVAKILKTYSRDSDFLARYGGEEFVYILPEMTSEQALAMGTKLREHIEKFEFSYANDPIEITVSGGISTVIAGEDDKDSIFKRADDALFKAKESGRNRIEVG